MLPRAQQGELGICHDQEEAVDTELKPLATEIQVSEMHDEHFNR